MNTARPLEFTQDWTHFDPVAYLDEYYGDLGPENLALLEFMVEAYQRIPKGGMLLDFGGGPTIYPLISAIHRVDEIHFADYLEANLEEVRRWLDADPTAFDWSPFIRKALELESGGTCSEEACEQRASELRERITRVLRCDASKASPIPGMDRPYDIVLTNFCAESATDNPSEWRSYMRNIVSVLKPRGWLVISALAGATQYAVGPHSFPAVDISEQDLLRMLEEMGFSSAHVRVRSVPADRPTRDYKGLMLAVAQKSAAGAEEPAA